jgi:UDP-N-acetyl-D-mannosaminuronic acid dehydrogenase
MLNKKSLNVAVVGGAGRVGLPLSFYIAKSNINVFSIDIDEEKITLVKNKKTTFVEDGLKDLINKQEKFKIHFTSDLNYIKKCDIVFVAIGTPLDSYLNPDYKYFFRNFTEISNYFKKKQLIILRSTLFPGTSKIVCNQLRNKNVKVAFCPERISQGNALKELKKLPQIISAEDDKTAKLCADFFAKIGIKSIIKCEFEEAEVTKLLCNSWRYLKFAIANQFYSICEDKNLDFRKIRKIMMFDYDRANDFPKSGFAAGPCLLKDTMQLSAYSRNQFTFANPAMVSNETLPDFLISKLKKNNLLKGVKIGILGMAFKPNNDDIRDSLAYKLKKKLEHEEAIVMCTDVYIRNNNFFSLKKTLKECRVIFIGCPHKEYKNIKFKKSVKIIDCWDYY